ncbi:hypothetical protein OUZ56_007689 [Daphnia magna]|uniref:Uncharacterized protein n=1 Tax=Daphnia magna TaxID=35525 RepID=A0ABR0AB07_9CRUS|nr:hypothetical protein OUZ56_007689 [Daphnia magna]
MEKYAVCSSPALDFAFFRAVLYKLSSSSCRGFCGGCSLPTNSCLSWKVGKKKKKQQHDFPERRLFTLAVTAGI